MSTETTNIETESRPRKSLEPQNVTWSSMAIRW